MIDLTGRVALVTGASRGVGKAVALKLAEAGADIVLNFAKSRPAADEAAGAIADLGRRVAEVQADVSEPDDIAAMLEWVRQTFGRLDILVSGVTAEPPASLLDTAPDRLAAALNADVRSLLLLVQSARPLLEQSGAGRVVAVSRGAAGGVVEAAVRRLAAELAPGSIAVNAVQAQSADSDLAGSVLFLASSLSRGVSGQTLVIGEEAAVPV
jgi:enoyl-[acyl-carrier protein] reductase III